MSIHFEQCRRGSAAQHAFFIRAGLTLSLASAIILSAACDIVRSDLNSLAGKSEGTLVANMGMTLEEVRGRSTLKLAPSVHYPTGEEMTAGGARFDFEVAGTSIRFESCRYYWLMTHQHGDLKLETVNIGASPDKLNVDKLAAAYSRVTQQLREDGWLQGHLHAELPAQFVPPKKRPWGNLFVWAKGDTLMMLRDKRMDDEKPGEDEYAGEYIMYVELHPRHDESYKVWEF
jgi:hypothetical protein